MCISEKYFSEIRYYAYVFAEHGIGTFHNIESDEVSFCILIEWFKVFLCDLGTVYLKINIWNMFG